MLFCGVTVGSVLPGFVVYLAWSMFVFVLFFCICVGVLRDISDIGLWVEFGSKTWEQFGSKTWELWRFVMVMTVSRSVSPVCGCEGLWFLWLLTRWHIWSP